MSAKIPDDLLRLLRCPVTGRPLDRTDDGLAAAGGPHYAVTASGIPRLADAVLSPEGLIQQQHYDRIATVYSKNLEQPHTQEYIRYLDRILFDVVGGTPLNTVAEVCCGMGEAFQLFGNRIGVGVGVDVSLAMLEKARGATADRRLFVQGDAVRLPLADGAFDAVFVLGGIHHVNDRPRLFNEIRRILRTGGRMFWREPVDDFLPWRAARKLIYRYSATLEADTERPLRSAETRRVMAESGLRLETWRTAGFLGYCVLMNSDVLAVNRIWSHVPGAVRLTRAAAAIDDWMLGLPGLTSGGALVVGSAVRTS